MNDDGSTKILLIALLIIFIICFESCQYGIATDENMSVGEKMYWLTR